MKGELPEGGRARGDGRCVGDTSSEVVLCCPLDAQRDVILCGLPVLAGRGSLDTTAAEMVSIMLRAAALRDFFGLVDLPWNDGGDGRRLEGGDVEEGASESKFPVLALISLVTEASNPSLVGSAGLTSPGAPPFACLAGSLPADLDFLPRAGDRDLAFGPPALELGLDTGERPPPPCSNFFNSEGSSLWGFSPKLVLSAALCWLEAATEPAIGVVTLFKWADIRGALGGGGGFRFFSTLAGELFAWNSDRLSFTSVILYLICTTRSQMCISCRSGIM